MGNQKVPTWAAIDIGSNTIRVVVARYISDHLEILATDEEMVRIGESVTSTGEISAQKSAAAIATLRAYKALAEQYAASPILAVATEAIRQAKNREEFLAGVLEATGLVVHLIEGDVEATLTFYGATCGLGKEAPVPARIGVMDLGGGSTELVLAKNMQMNWRISVPIGSGWIHDRYFHADPPTHDDLAVAATFLQTYVQGLRIKQRPPLLVVTGGSANALLRLARYAFHVSAQETHLTYEDLLRCEGLLSALPAQEIAERYKVPASRAEILPAGVLIIRTMMVHLQVREISISSHGIREGVLLAYARHGSQWLQRVRCSARDVTQEAVEVDAEISRAASESAEEPFDRSGHRMLLDRTRKMLERRDEVLKHEDVEAVHRMRVASRRLRAVLDAYESACNPKLFKKAYRCVKQLADMLGKARDTDVMIEHLRAQLEQTPAEEQLGIQWLIDRLSSYREQHQVVLEAFLKQIDEDAWKRKIVACLPVGGVENGKS